MKQRAHLVVRFLFKLSLCASLILGACLTVGQLAGVVLTRPGLITGSEALFFEPAVTAATTFGVLGWLAQYVAPPVSEREAREIAEAAE